MWKNGPEWEYYPYSEKPRYKPACNFEVACLLEISRCHCSHCCSFQWRIWVLNSCFSCLWISPGSLPTFENDPIWPSGPEQPTTTEGFSSIQLPCLQLQKPPIHCTFRLTHCSSTALTNADFPGDSCLHLNRDWDLELFLQHSAHNWTEGPGREISLCGCPTYSQVRSFSTPIQFFSISDTCQDG